MPIRLLGIRLSELANIGVQANIFNDVGRKNDLYKAIALPTRRMGSVGLFRRLNQGSTGAARTQG